MTYQLKVGYDDTISLRPGRRHHRPSDRLLTLTTEDNRHAEVLLSREDLQQLIEMLTLAHIQSGDPLVQEVP